MSRFLFTLTLIVSGIFHVVGDRAYAQTTTAPHLEQRGKATQLIVDGKPHLVLGGGNA